MKTEVTRAAAGMNDSRLTSVVLGNLEWLGGQYCAEYLRCFDLNRLRANWWAGLYFVLSRSFMRGRSDDLSMRYFNHAFCIMARQFAIDETELDGALSRLINRSDEFSRERVETYIKQAPKGCHCPAQVNQPDLLRDLCPHTQSHTDTFARTRAGSLPLNNEGDLKMLAAVLRQVVETRNIFVRVEQLVRESGIAEAYEFLLGYETVIHAGKSRALKRFPYIGDKIAGLIIRDICLLNQLPPNIGPSILNSDTARADLRRVFPVDTWVRKIARKIGWDDAYEVADEEIKDFFLDRCENRNPAKVAAGIWYLGFNALDLFIDRVLIKYRLDANGQPILQSRTTLDSLRRFR